MVGVVVASVPGTSTAKGDRLSGKALLVVVVEMPPGDGGGVFQKLVKCEGSNLSTIDHQ